MHASELYSPLRLCAAALNTCLTLGLSVDLRVNDHNENAPWEVSIVAKRENAKTHVETRRSC